MISLKLLVRRRTDRDFHTNIWQDIPAPQYDSEDGYHRDFTSLCVEAENSIVQVLKKSNPSYK